MSVLSTAYNWVSFKALNFCARRGYTRGIKALIWLGFNVNATDAQKNTPLHIACEVGNVEIVKILVSANADVNALNSRLDTPLHSLTFNCKLLQKTIEIISIFKGKNASTNMRNQENQTPADYLHSHLSSSDYKPDEMDNVRNLLNMESSVIDSNISTNESTEPLASNAKARTATNEQAQQIISDIEETKHTEPLLPSVSSIDRAVADEYATHIVNTGLSTAPITEIPEIKGIPLFHYAAKYGLINILNYLLGIMNVDVDTKHAGKTALHYATEGCQIQAATILINAGSDTLALDFDRRTPLFDAIQGYETNYLQSHADYARKKQLVTDKEIYSETIIDKEAFAKAELFLEICISIIDLSYKEPANYFTLLDYAVKKKANKIHVAELLYLKILTNNSYGEIVVGMAGCMLDDDNKALPLHTALDLGLQDVAELLLLIEDNKSENKFSYLNLREGKNYRSALDMATIAGNLAVVNKLLQYKVETNVDSITKPYEKHITRINTPLMYASKYNHTNVALALIPHSNVKAEYDFDWNAEILPPVYHAAVHGNNELVKALLSAGANFSVRHVVRYENRLPIYTFETLLHVAARFAKNAVVIEILSHNGADPHAIGMHGKTMLHYAAENKEFNTVDCFLRMNVAVNRQDDRGNTALHLALANKNCAVALTLINTPFIDVDLQNHDGDTALHIAVILNLVPMIDALLAAGANIDSARTTDGATPLHMAICHDALDALLCLLTYNPKVIQANKDGQTPLQYAVTWRIRQDQDQARLRLGISLESYLYAAAKNKAKAIMHILKYKKDNNMLLNEFNSNNEDLMHLATEGWSCEAISVLRKCGIDLDIKNTKQETALAVATKNSNTCYEPCRHLKVVKALIFRGASIHDASAKLNDARLAKDVAKNTILLWYKHYFKTEFTKKNVLAELPRGPVENILRFCLGPSEFVTPIINAVLNQNFEPKDSEEKKRSAANRKRQANINTF